MANNDTDVNVNIGASNAASGVISGAIADFKKFWATAAGGTDAQAAAGNMETLAGKLGVSNKALLGVGIAGGVAAAGAVAIGVSAAKAATNFQELTTQLVTGAGESEKNLDMIRSGILNVSDATGTSASDLTSAMFMIESAGYHGASGLNVLKVAAEGAKVGGADLGTTANALTTVMHDYASQGITSAQAMNFLTSTVQNGKMHMEDLAGSMGKILPTAAALHVPVNQVGGAIAALTAAGSPAARATTALNQTMLQLVKPSTAAQKSLQEVGLTSVQVGDTLTKQGLQQALELITDHLGKKFPVGSAQYMQALATITGGTKGLTGALGVTGANMQTFVNNIKDISDKTKEAGNSVMGWNAVQGDEKTKMDQAKESIQNAKIALGEGLLPAITDVTKAIVKIVTPIAEWINSHQKLAAMIIAGVAAFGTFIATTLIAVKVFSMIKDAVMAVRTAAIALNSTFLTNPITLAIMAIIAVTILLVTHWNDVKQWFSDFWNFMKGIFEDGLNWIKKNWEDLTPILLGPIGIVIALWHAFGGQIKAIVGDVVGWIEGVWNSIVGFIGGVIGRITGAIRSGVSGFGNLLMDAGRSLIDGLVHGIEGTAGKVFDSVKNIGSKAVSALKGVLKIFSPSQVFAELGDYVGQGLVQGIQGTEANVASATTKLGTAAIVGGQSAISQPISNVTNSSTSNSSNHNVTIQTLQLVMPNGATMQTFIQSLNQDGLNVSRGLSPVQGAYNVG